MPCPLQGTIKHATSALGSARPKPEVGIVQLSAQKQQMANELAERGQQAAALQQELSASHAKLALMTQRAELAMQRAARSTSSRPALPPR